MADDHRRHAPADDTAPAGPEAAPAAALLTRGRRLEVLTLGWNVVGIAVLAVAAIRAGSVARGGFGLDSLIEIGASTVVLWEPGELGDDVHHARQQRAMRLIGVAFVALALYLAVQSSVLLALGARPGRSALGIGWTALAAAMFALARGKAVTGRALASPVLQTEGRVTTVDGTGPCAAGLSGRISS